MKHAQPSNFQTGITNNYQFNGHFTQGDVSKNMKQAGLGMELVNDFNLGIHHAFYRTYDPQLGRMMQIDPLAEDPAMISTSTYNAFLNNPIMYSDPNGDTGPAVPATGATATKEVVKEVSKKTLLQRAKGAVGAFASKTVGLFVSLMLSPQSMGDGTVYQGDISISNETMKPDDWEDMSLDDKVSWLENVETPDADDLEDLEYLKTIRGDGDESGTSTKSDRVDTKSDLEKDLNQLEGIERKNDADKKEVKGAKQNKTHNIDKSKQKSSNSLKNVKKLKDAEGN